MEPPEQQPREPASRASAVRPWSSRWVGHYDRASRARHERGGYRRMRAEARRRRRLETVIAAVAGASVVALASIFYVILSR